MKAQYTGGAEECQTFYSPVKDHPNFRSQYFQVGTHTLIIRKNGFRFALIA